MVVEFPNSGDPLMETLTTVFELLQKEYLAWRLFFGMRVSILRHDVGKLLMGYRHQ